jgi:hypothetical protein
MAYYLQTFLFTLLPFIPLMAQSTDTTDLCLTRTADLAQQIAANANAQSLESETLLRTWEASCDYSEPAERLRLLMAIKVGTFDPRLHNDYFTEGIRRFRSRLTEAEMPDAQAFYTEHAAWFCYLPLNSAYDLYTRELAEQALSKQKKGTIGYAICLLLAHKTTDYDRERFKKAYKYTPIHPHLKQRRIPKPIYEKPYHHGVSLGIWAPSGTVKQALGVGIQAGYVLSCKVNHRWRVELIGDMYVQPQPGTFTVSGPAGRTEAESDAQGTFGVGCVRRYKKSDAKSWIDLHVGLGYQWLSTDVERELETSDTFDGSTITIGTFDLPLGVEFAKSTWRGHAIGIGFWYHLRPYTLDSRLLTPMSFSSTSTLIKFYF